MRTLFSCVMAAFVLGFVFSAELIAEGKLEKRLVKEGWVKVTAKELKAMMNYTASDDYGWAQYIDPSGTKVVTQRTNGQIIKATREITADGKYCIHYVGGEPKNCRFLWKRGNVYLRLSRKGKGTISGEYTIKPGNTENL